MTENPWIPRILLRAAVHSPVRLLPAARDLAPSALVVMSLTHARIYMEKRGAFERATLALLGQLGDAEGLLMYSIRRELLGDQAWTMTAWRADEYRDQFLASEMHSLALLSARDSIKSMRSRRISLTVNDLPLRWSRALRLLGQESQLRP